MRDAFLTADCTDRDAGEDENDDAVGSSCPMLHAETFFR
jgi:hypothetical protein